MSSSDRLSKLPAASTTSQTPMGGPRIVIVPDINDSDSSSGASTSDEEDHLNSESTPSSVGLDRDELGGNNNNNNNEELPQDYWQIQKLIKYIKAGNQTATILALCFLKEYDLTTEINQKAIKDVGGLEVLINVLESPGSRTKFGALSVLASITLNPDIRRRVMQLGAVPLLISVLSSTPNTGMQILSAETIANLAQIRKARRGVRHCNGIPKLIDILDQSDVELSSKSEPVCVCAAAAQALWALSVSSRNRETMRKAGILAILARLVHKKQIKLIVPVAGILMECASEKKYQLAIRTLNMIPSLVKHLQTNNEELKRLCAHTIFKCAVDDPTRSSIRTQGGLEPLVEMLKDPLTREDAVLCAGVTGALSQCAALKQNAEHLVQLESLPIFVTLLDHQDERVLTNVVGALAQCAKSKENRTLLFCDDGIEKLIHLLNLSHEPLLANTANVLAECAKDVQGMELIEQFDGVRLLWSLLKNPCQQMQAAAAWALCPCINNAQNSGDMVRSFVGGLELIVRRLRSDNMSVLAAVCAAIASIASDKENLAVITDHGVIATLSELVHTLAAREMTATPGEKSNRESGDSILREHLCAALANCCSSLANARELGRLGALAEVVGYLRGPNPNVHRNAARALAQLSKDPRNCVELHRCGVVPYLLKTIGSSDEDLQEASAVCLGNIRHLALNIVKGKTNKTK